MSFNLLLVVILAPFLLQIVQCNKTREPEAAPAVWGDPAPDYSSVVLGDNSIRYMHALLFVDEKITSHYEFDMLRVKREVLKVVEEANTYFIQLKIGIVVVDILQTMRSNMSLHMFQEYRNSRLHMLPHHDFASLMALRYPGGLAYVGGMCSDLSVMLCGFYPQEPAVMGSIFFHEVAHLVGVPHKQANSSLYIPNCTCTGSKEEEDMIGGCLRIPGFDHDCTAQQFVNVIYKNKCLRTTPREMRKNDAICGNGVREASEECDCGLRKQCFAYNCVPETCTYRIHPTWVWLSIIAFFLLSLLLLYWTLRHRTYHFPRFTMLNCFKPPHGKTTPFKNPGTTKPLSKSTLDKKSPYATGGVDPNSIVVLLDQPPRSAATLHRPKVPPPPPPPKATISVEPGPNFYEVPNTRQSMMRDDISWKFEDFDSDEEISPEMTYSSYRGQTGVPTCPSYPPFTPINRVTVVFHGSGDTMETECRSSSASSSSAINGTSI